MLSIIGGIIAAVLGLVWVIGSAWDEILMVLQGTLPLMLIFGGIIAIAAGISSIKEEAAAKKEEEELAKEEAKEKKEEPSQK